MPSLYSHAGTCPRLCWLIDVESEHDKQWCTSTGPERYLHQNLRPETKIRTGTPKMPKRNLDQTGPDWTGPDRSDIAEQRLPIKDQGSRIKDQGSRIMDHWSWIKDQGSWIKYQGSRIMDQGSWTLFWHGWPSWKGYGRDIKTFLIYNRFSIIL